jgi:hypothetical protein
MKTLNEKQILNMNNETIDDEDDYYATPTDNDIISIKNEYKQEGNIFFITVSKNKWTHVSVSIDNNIVSIFGCYQIPDAWSNKDDRVGGKEIHNLINGDYKAVVLQKRQDELEEINIIICSQEYL